MALSDALNTEQPPKSRSLNAERAYRCCITRGFAEVVALGAIADSAFSAAVEWGDKLLQFAVDERPTRARTLEVTGQARAAGGVRTAVESFGRALGASEQQFRAIADSLEGQRFTYKLGGVAGIVAWAWEPVREIVQKEEEFFSEDVILAEASRLTPPGLITNLTVELPNPYSEQHYQSDVTHANNGSRLRATFNEQVGATETQTAALRAIERRTRTRTAIDECQRCIWLAVFDNTGPRAWLKGAHVRKRF